MLISINLSNIIHGWLFTPVQPWWSILQPVLYIIIHWLASINPYGSELYYPYHHAGDTEDGLRHFLLDLYLRRLLPAPQKNQPLRQGAQRVSFPPGGWLVLGWLGGSVVFRHYSPGKQFRYGGFSKSGIPKVDGLFLIMITIITIGWFGGTPIVWGIWSRHDTSRGIEQTITNNNRIE